MEVLRGVLVRVSLGVQYVVGTANNNIWSSEFCVARAVWEAPPTFGSRFECVSVLVWVWYIYYYIVVIYHIFYCCLRDAA